MWLFDIDGTCALMNGRKPYDWSRVSEDLPSIPVLLVVRALIFDNQEVGFLTGRMEECRADTQDWLYDHIDVSSPMLADHVSRLWMRPDADYRPDEVVKLEIYRDQIAPHYKVSGVFDDRDKVVRAWRSIGLPCFQVAEGNF
jgi:hypothetical protein